MSSLDWAQRRHTKAQRAQWHCRLRSSRLTPMVYPRLGAHILPYRRHMAPIQPGERGLSCSGASGGDWVLPRFYINFFWHTTVWCLLSIMFVRSGFTGSNICRKWITGKLEGRHFNTNMKWFLLGVFFHTLGAETVHDFPCRVLCSRMWCVTHASSSALPFLRSLALPVLLLLLGCASPWWHHRPPLPNLPRNKPICKSE